MSARTNKQTYSVVIKSINIIPVLFDSDKPLNRSYGHDLHCTGEIGSILIITLN